MRRRQAGEHVLPLAFGEAGLPVHPELVEVLSTHATRNGYGPVSAVPQLQEAAAGYWSRRRLPTAPDQVVAGPGSKPLLYGLLAALGGDAVLAQPSWVSYAAQCRLLGGTPMYVPTSPGVGGVPDPDLLVQHLDHARATGRRITTVVLTLPDNPTGTAADADTVARVCRIAREWDLFVISDEIYRDLRFAGEDGFVSPAELAPERTAVTTGVSKNLALGGWRLGVCRLPDSPTGRRVRDRLLTIGSEIWSSAPQPVQFAAAHAFTEPAVLRDRVRDSVRLHATVAHAVADRFRYAGVRVPTPQGGFYLYPDFTAHADLLESRWSVTTSADLASLLLDRFGVGVLPGSAFGDDPKSLRLRVATSQLYGDTDADREASLRSAYPTRLPWLRGSLARLDEVLGELLTG
ncbi:aminotransferase class I/II-fold pyridoxal phosphate-dependent enzyme [Stackebrandtia albiflava]